MSAIARGETLPALSPDDKRFRRRQVSQSRKKHRAEPWVLSIVRRVMPALLLTTLVGLAAHQVYRSPHFQVQRISVRGNQHLSVGEVRSLLAGLEGQHVLQVDIDEWRVRLLESPWVADARLHRVLPGTIEVAIVERTPLATMRSGDQLFLLDDTGGIIDEYGPQYADIDLPIVDGLERDGPMSADRRRRELLLSRILSALSARSDMLARISQIDVSDAHDVVVMAQNDEARVHLGDRDFTERLRSYFELKGALRERVPSIDYVDVRFGSRVFVRPSHTRDSRSGVGSPAR